MAKLKRANHQPLELQMTNTNGQGWRAIWSEWRDSNPRPLVPQTSALTGLRYTPALAVIEKALLRRNAQCEAGRSERRIAPRFPLSQTILRAPRPKLPAAHGIKDVLARRQFGQGRPQPHDLFGP
jgi:hypothetical protein